MNLPLFTLQIMPWAINSFQLLANRSIPVEVNMEYLRFTFRYLKFNGFQVTTWILSQVAQALNLDYAFKGTTYNRYIADPAFLN